MTSRFSPRPPTTCRSSPAAPRRGLSCHTARDPACAGRKPVHSIRLGARRHVESHAHAGYQSAQPIASSVHSRSSIPARCPPTNAVSGASDRSSQKNTITADERHQKSTSGPGKGSLCSSTETCHFGSLGSEDLVELLGLGVDELGRRVGRHFDRQRLHGQDGGGEPVRLGTTHGREPSEGPAIEAAGVTVEVSFDLFGVLLAPVAEVDGEVVDVVVASHPDIGGARPATGPSNFRRAGAAAWREGA